MNFDQMGLAEPILRAVRAEGYSTPTPIQAQTIVPVRDGRDLLGCAQTGTGKTAAFALPILHRLTQAQARRGGRPIRCLVLAPTRELAAQVGDSFRAYGRNVQLMTTVIFGGVGQNPQVQALRRGVDIVVACPGRLIDLIGQGHVKLDAVEILVLDEADRMLDMGFLPDIRRIMALMPRERQTLLFSATMPGEIRTLARGIMRDPVEVAVAPVSSSAETVTQGVFHVTRPQKQPLLTKLLGDPTVERTLVFTRTKHGADKVVRKLAQSHIRAEAIHGNKSQNARQRALDGFRNGTLSVLVASDIAARGLDVDGISHVINFDVPNEPETYVHRIGRTGRAGKSGTAWSLCDGEERSFLADIERTIRRRLDVLPIPQLPQLPPDPMPTYPQRNQPRGGGGSRGGRGGGGFRGGHGSSGGHGGGSHQSSVDTRHDGHGQPQRRDHQGHGHGQRRSNTGFKRSSRPSQW